MPLWYVRPIKGHEQAQADLARMDQPDALANGEMRMTRIKLAGLIGIVAIGALGGCTDADVASTNLSKAADNFEISRRVVFYNGITGDYILSVEGLCSLGNYDKSGTLSVTCKTGENAYKKHFLGLSDNVTFFAEQVEPANVSAYHYRVIFKPQTIVPDFDFRGDTNELTTNRN
jgi:hypothetical protein